MTCPRCHNQYQAIIEQAPDSYAKQVRCLACGWIGWLKHFKHLTKNYD